MRTCWLIDADAVSMFSIKRDRPILAGLFFDINGVGNYSPNTVL